MKLDAKQLEILAEYAAARRACNAAQKAYRAACDQHAPYEERVKLSRLYTEAAVADGWARGRLDAALGIEG